MRFAFTVATLLAASPVHAAPRAEFVRARSCQARNIIVAQSETPGRTPAGHEPGGCTPRCRKGYFCKSGKCVSLCNPTCRANERCTDGAECVPFTLVGRPTRFNYVAAFAGGRAGVNSAAKGTGDVRLEFGGKYIAFQIGPGFSDKVTMVRAILLGHVPFQPVTGVPFYIVPTVGAGYAFHVVDDQQDTRIHDLLLTLGTRVRYDVTPRIALFANILQVEIGVARFQNNGVGHTGKVPVNWNLTAGAAFLY